MKRTKSNPITRAATRNPSVVLAAFAPETTFVLDMRGWMLLEAIGNPYATGEAPSLGDTLVMLLVMTDFEAVQAAHASGRLKALVDEAGRGRRPADIVAMSDKIAAAIKAAFDPIDSGTEGGEKKSSPESAGGSPS